MFEQLEKILNARVSEVIGKISELRKKYDLSSDKVYAIDNNFRVLPKSIVYFLGELEALTKVLTYVKNQRKPSYDGLTPDEASRKALYDTVSSILKELNEDPFPWNEYMSAIESGMVVKPNSMSRPELTMAVMSIVAEQYWINNLKEKEDVPETSGSSDGKVI